MATQNATRIEPSLKAPRAWTRPDCSGQHGTRERLLRVGIPDARLKELPAAGKKRGERAFFEDGRQVYVSVGEQGVFYVQTTTVICNQQLEAKRGAAFARFIDRTISSPAGA